MSLFVRTGPGRRSGARSRRVPRSRPRCGSRRYLLSHTFVVLCLLRIQADWSVCLLWTGQGVAVAAAAAAASTAAMKTRTTTTIQKRCVPFYRLRA
jgi:hypothetical protein